jgi:LuxR family maltose regulon positive regulatory protein
LSAVTGRPAEAERWADVVDRREYGVASGPEDPAVEGWAALRRALLCRHGVKQMLADADEAACRLAAGGVSEPAAALMQGVARVLSGDVDGGDASLKNAASAAEVSGAPDVAAVALCERSLVAMGRDEWSKASALAVRAHMVMRKAEMEEFYATALVCAIRASIALHTADTSTARQELVRSQRWRPLLTCALPHFAVQARIELARVCLALSDPAGAWTLMREVDDVLRCRPDLGDLVNQAMAVQARLPEEHDPSAPETSALTAAELRLLPVLGRCGAA